MIPAIPLLSVIPAIPLLSVIPAIPLLSVIPAILLLSVISTASPSPPREGRFLALPGFALRQRSASSGQTPMWSCSSSSATRCSIPSACV